MKLLVTGSNGFIGRNLISVLSRDASRTVIGYDIDSSIDFLENALRDVDAVVHLAGSNRPKDPSEFYEVNRGLTERITEILRLFGKKTPIIFASSRQAALDNDYGKSKREAETVLEEYSRAAGAPVAAFRFDNVFGKWSRPSYNSVVATFCHNAVHGLPLTVNDPSARVRFIHIDDAVSAIIGTLDSPGEGFRVETPEPVFERSIGELAELVTSFAAGRKTAEIPDVSDPFVRKLHSTYLSFVDADDLSVPQLMRSDERGWLFEFVKSPSMGQIFVSTTKPGKVRGNHWHDTKIEKFCLVRGKARISLRSVESNERIDFDVDTNPVKVVDIPPGFTHSITNTGDEDCVVLFWANEIFDPSKPDTYFLEV